jgi:hypothetical protein
MGDTMAEGLLARAAGRETADPGDHLVCEVDVVMTQDMHTPGIMAKLRDLGVEELPDPERPVLRFEPLEPGQSCRIGERTFEAIPVRHAVPAVGYRCSDGGAAVCFSGDTSSNDTLWPALNAAGELDLLIVEVGYPDADESRARQALHYCPRLLAADPETAVVCENCNNCTVPQAAGEPGVCRTPAVLAKAGRLRKAGAYDRPSSGGPPDSVDGA